MTSQSASVRTVTIASTPYPSNGQLCWRRALLVLTGALIFRRHQNFGTKGVRSVPNELYDKSGNAFVAVRRLGSIECQ